MQSTHSPQSLISLLSQGKPLDAAQAGAAMKAIMEGEWTGAQLAEYLVLLSQQGETAAVVAASAQAMRDKALQVQTTRRPLLDVVGSGGDGIHSINVSSLSALIVAAAGGAVAKHGNRAMSGRFGSADVLESLGIPIELTPQQAAQMLEQHGFVFMFASLFHPAMKHAAPTRKEIGIPTLFNYLGPLTNPAGADHYLLGVNDSKKMKLFADALVALGVKRAMVVHGEDGMDEITLSAPTQVIEINDGETTEYTLHPRQFGLLPVPLNSLSLGSAEESAQMAADFVKGQAPEPHANLVLLNAGAGLTLMGITESIAEGISHAKKIVSSGTLQTFVTSLAA